METSLKFNAICTIESYRSGLPNAVNKQPKVPAACALLGGHGCVTLGCSKHRQHYSKP